MLFKKESLHKHAKLLQCYDSVKSKDWQVAIRCKSKILHTRNTLFAQQRLFEQKGALGLLPCTCKHKRIDLALDGTNLALINSFESAPKSALKDICLYTYPKEIGFEEQVTFYFSLYHNNCSCDELEEVAEDHGRLFYFLVLIGSSGSLCSSAFSHLKNSFLSIDLDID